MNKRSLRYWIALAALGVVTAQAKPLVVCTEASPEGFDIAQYTTATTADASAETIFDRLVSFTPGTTELRPGLAESWEISADGLQYTFHLRKGVKFHTTDYFKPTREFNADDVLWSFNRQLDPKNPWHDKAAMGFPYFESMGLNTLIKSIDKVDEHTVRFTLNHPESPFLSDLAMSFASIYSAEYGDQLLAAGKTDQLNSKPIGTGPFIFSRYSKDSQVRYVANPDYFRGKPPSDQLIFAISPDSSVRLQRLKANECQIALYPQPDDLASIKADPTLKLQEIDALMIGYVALNVKHGPLADVRVRQAINMAIDRDAYVDAMFGKGLASPAVNPYPPTVLGYDHAIKPWPYDPEKAKALLKEAGVPDGQELNIYASSGAGPILPNPSLGTQVLQADLAKVGIKANIRLLEWGELVQRAKTGEPDILFFGWAGDNGDPDNFLTPNLSCDAVPAGNNPSFWCNKEFDDLINKARAVSDSAERVKLYEQAQVVFHEQAPWAPLVYPKLFNAARANVTGFTLNPLTTNNFSTTEVK